MIQRVTMSKSPGGRILADLIYRASVTVRLIPMIPLTGDFDFDTRMETN